MALESTQLLTTQSQLLMTLGKKPFENIVLSSIFSFSHIFLPFENKVQFFSNIYVVCKCFQFRTVCLLFGEEFTKLKVFAEDKMHVTQKLICIIKVKKIVVKEKLLVTGIFFFFHNVFKILPYKAHNSPALFGKALYLSKRNSSEHSGKSNTYQCYCWTQVV